MSVFILNAFVTQIPAADEIIFIRITNNLPDYSSRMTWFSLDGKTDPNYDGVIDPATNRDDSPFYELAYEVPIWHHPPFANYLAWPFVKLLYHEGTNDEIRQGVKNLRVVAWMMFTFCISASIILVRRMSKNDLVFLLSIVPLAACYVLFTHWGHNWFYHDTFMLTSLMIALLMRGTRYQKYYYIPLALMVGSKGIGFLLLLPFAVENKKVLWCLLAWVPYLLMCYFTTGDVFYKIKHWVAVRELVAQIGAGEGEFGLGAMLLHNFQDILRGMSRVWLFMLTMTLPVGYVLFQLVKKRTLGFYSVLFAMASVVGLLFGAHYYQMTTMMVTGMLLVGSALSMYRKEGNYAEISAN